MQVFSGDYAIVIVGEMVSGRGLHLLIEDGLRCLCSYWLAKGYKSRVNLLLCLQSLSTIRGSGCTLKIKNSLTLSGM